MTTTRTTHSTRARSARHLTTNRLLSIAALEPDPHARERAVEEAVLLNMPVARSVAARFRDRGVPIEDLEQVAYAALLRAARAFDPGLADDFLSYAVPTMRGELKDSATTRRPYAHRGRSRRSRRRCSPRSAASSTRPGPPRRSSRSPASWTRTRVTWPRP